MRNTTLNMISLLPSWMKIKKNPEDTQGGQFLDVIGGQTKDIFDLLEAVLIMKHPANDPFITDEEGNPFLTVAGVDIFNADFVYRIKMPDILMKVSSFNVYAEDTRLRRCSSVFDFYRQDSGYKYYLDQDDKYIYLRKKFSKVIINGATFDDIEKYHVWGPYDEVGLLIGCPRLQDETNIDYRSRLLEVFRMPGSSTKDGLQNYISRSLGIEKEQVDIFEFTDEYVKRIFHNNENISEELWEFFELSDKINSVVGSSYWEVIDNYNKGIKYLPIYWGSSLDAWNSEEIQSGIGYDDDLLITPPEQIDRVQSFEYSVGVEGIKLTPNNKYPDIRFKYRIQASAYKYGEDGIMPEPYNFSVLSAREIPAEITISAEKDYFGKESVILNDSTIYGSEIDILTSVAYEDCLGLGNDNYAAGETCNPLDTKKELTGYTTLNIFILLKNKKNIFGEIEYLRAIDVVYTNELSEKRHIIFNRQDYGSNGSQIIDDDLYVDISRYNTTAPSIHRYDGIKFIEDGVKISSADHAQYFLNKTDWLRNENDSTIGIDFLEDGSISIK